MSYSKLYYLGILKYVNWTILCDSCRYVCVGKTQQLINIAKTHLIQTKSSLAISLFTIVLLCDASVSCNDTSGGLPH